MRKSRSLLPVRMTIRIPAAARRKKRLPKNQGIRKKKKQTARSPETRVPTQMIPGQKSPAQPIPVQPIPGKKRVLILPLTKMIPPFRTKTARIKKRTILHLAKHRLMEKKNPAAAKQTARTRKTTVQIPRQSPERIRPKSLKRTRSL